MKSGFLLQFNKNTKYRLKKPLSKKATLHFTLVWSMSHVVTYSRIPKTSKGINICFPIRSDGDFELKKSLENFARSENNSLRFEDCEYLSMNNETYTVRY